MPRSCAGSDAVPDEQTAGSGGIVTPATVVIVPPLGDVTLVPEWTAGPHRVLDPGRRFVARVLATAPVLASGEPTSTPDGSAHAGHVEGTSRTGDGGGSAGSAGDGERVVRLRAGVAVLADPAGPMARLRAAALLVPAVTEGHPGSAVDLVLDDLELRDGTTEDSASALRAALGPAPYDAELEETLASVTPGDDVWLILERDQQLPAVLTLAARLPGPIRVTGRYARQNWPVLSRLEPLRHAHLANPPAPLYWRVVGLPEAAALTETGLRQGVRAGAGSSGPPRTSSQATDSQVVGSQLTGSQVAEFRAEEPRVRWRERAGDPVPPGPWAGRVSLRAAVEAPGELIASGCLTAVLGLCAADEEFVGRGGSVWPAEKARAALGTLRAAGITVLAELWLGAPGISADRSRAAVAALAAPDAPVDRIAGLRPFDWPAHWLDPRWGGTGVDRLPSALDLARHRAFRADGTLSREQVQDLVAEIGPALARDGVLIPARVAAAYLVADPPLEATVPGAANGTNDVDVVSASNGGSGPNGTNDAEGAHGVNGVNAATATADPEVVTATARPGAATAPAGTEVVTAPAGTEAPAGTTVALAPDTVLVAGPVEGGQWYAVDLRAGRIVRLDPRIASRLRAGRRPVPEAEALPGVAAATRTRVLEALAGSGLLVRR
ncbi:hypothetical protein DQ384_31455 [Sphaerisporangium album]|uniref:Uncharacterized protein n=1 Tax=Sphaerisporangium album TaxID=509200 RepID=A0A367F4T3_9ACTN|nr:hypothetical protein DQ384_31455 [Sphaerisporangium album]